MEKIAFLTASSREAFLQPLASPPGVYSLCLNRPKTKNALSVRLVKEFLECLDYLQFDRSARVVIIHSTTPGSFCAGADLAERRTMTQAQVSNFLNDLRLALGKLENLPMPTIAAIDGPALGGGLEMSLACDLRVAGSTVTKIGLPETRLGVIPGAGGTQRAVRLLGLSKTKDLIYTGRMLTAGEAFNYGLVDYVSSDAYDRALLLAREMAANAPLALRAAKEAISFAQDLTLENGLDRERKSYESLLTSKDRLEALEAFKEKRAPIFRGE